MNIPCLCEAFVNIMREECRLLEEFYKKEKELKEFVKGRDWGKLQRAIEEITPLSESLSEIEKERDSLYKTLKEKVSPLSRSFYSTLNSLPSEYKKELVDVYRTLKILVVKVQGQTKSIENIVYTLSGTIANIMEEIYPYRRGKIYSSSGRAKETGINPLVLNRQL